LICRRDRIVAVVIDNEAFLVEQSIAVLAEPMETIDFTLAPLSL
jgi:hypothetical protein